MSFGFFKHYMYNVSLESTSCLEDSSCDTWVTSLINQKIERVSKRLDENDCSRLDEEFMMVYVCKGGGRALATIPYWNCSYIIYVCMVWRGGIQNITISRRMNKKKNIGFEVINKKILILFITLQTKSQFLLLSATSVIIDIYWVALSS